MTIGVFFGSRSPEHDVSIITGTLISKGLEQLGHKVIPIYISKEGVWHTGGPLGNLDFYKKPGWQNKLDPYSGFVIGTNAPRGKFVISKSGLRKKSFVIDLAFPGLHGSNGEDGTIQGLFEMLDVPYVGCDIPSSAIAMDKVLTKEFYQKHDIPTTKFISLEKGEWGKDKASVLKRVGSLSIPVFIKPARLGSSIGITRATTKKEVEFAIEVALHYDDKVLVEEAVSNLVDITCAVLGNEDPKPSLLQESTFQGDFFTYSDKYLEDSGAQLGKAQKKLVIPASLDSKTTEKIRDMAVQIYKLLGCSGTARVDFLYDKKTKKFFANEINTLPGTLYHHLWKASGVSFRDLLTKLITLAEERYKRRQKLTYTFDSDILNQAGSGKAKLQRLGD